jgi:hypothetical protein
MSMRSNALVLKKPVENAPRTSIEKHLSWKAAAEEGAPQGGSAGGGSQKAAEAEGEEGAIARFFGLWSRYFALT